VCREGSGIESVGSGRGVYALVLRVRRPGVCVQVGALGELRFRAGCYCYVGSALGGLRGRLGRHLSSRHGRRHWHVDYLRERSRVAGGAVWRTPHRDECRLSRQVSRLAEGDVAGFGATDCHCRSHLYYFPTDPTGLLARITLRGRRPRLFRSDARGNTRPQ